MKSLIISLLLLCGIHPALATRCSQPNILFIIADDLGPQLGCYGDEVARTPYIDALAAQGVRFNRAHVTAASCSPPRGSIFTGLYPHQHGMFSLAQRNWSRMHDDVPKLPNELKRCGYATAIIGKTHFQPFNQFEFDLYEHHTKKMVHERDVRYMNERGAVWLNTLTDDEPFFLVMSYIDPHRAGAGGPGRYEKDKNHVFPRICKGLPENPLPPSETRPIPFLGVDSSKVRQENSDYYACVQRFDTGVGELLEMMKSRGFLENTLIVLIGDHGPDLTRGKISAYATATHIPLLLVWPGTVPAGVVHDELVSTIDLFPTFLDAAGADVILPDERQTGDSLLKLVSSSASDWRTALGTEFITHVPWHFYPRYTVMNGRYQFIHNLAAGRYENPLMPHNYCYAWWEVQKEKYAGTPIRKVYGAVELPPEFELFDLRNDPFEFHNLAENPEYADLVEAMKKQVLDWRTETKDPFLDPAFTEAYREKVEQMRLSQ